MAGPEMLHFLQFGIKLVSYAIAGLQRLKKIMLRA
jgi:hypothetical protein